MFWEWFKFAKVRGLEKGFMEESMRGNYDSVVENLYRISDFEFKSGLSPGEAVKDPGWNKLVYNLNLQRR